MKLIINGNLNESYVQTLCLVFFPCEKFSKTEAQPDISPCAVVNQKALDGGVLTEVTLSVGSIVTTGYCFEENNGNYSLERLNKISCGKAFFEAGKKLTKTTPAWGILTGVRPSKLAFEAMKSGLSYAKTKKYFVDEYLLNPKKAALILDVAAAEKPIIDACGDNTCSMYISIPFCPSRCSYCSFVSFTSPKLLSLIDDYLIQLIKDLEEEFATIKSLGLKLSTIYIGGGTPTTLNEKQLELLLNTIFKLYDVSSLEEYTLEAGRPDTITAEKLRIANEYGVTRISINCQTLNNDVLETIGRKHTAEDFYRAFEIASGSQIKQINTDLIAGLPGEGFASFSQSIDSVISLRPSNLTFHTLCLKKSSDFTKSGIDMNRRVLTDTSKCVDFSQLSAKNTGYYPYYIYRQKNTVANLENVGFCLPGCEGRYNIYMMEEVHSIFAVGAGAVSKLVSKDRGKIERIFEYKYPYEYLSDEKRRLKSNKREIIERFYVNRT